MPSPEFPDGKNDKYPLGADSLLFAPEASVKTNSPAFVTGSNMLGNESPLLPNTPAVAVPSTPASVPLTSAISTVLAEPPLMPLRLTVIVSAPPTALLQA